MCREKLISVDYVIERLQMYVNQWINTRTLLRLMEEMPGVHIEIDREAEIRLEDTSDITVLYADWVYDPDGMDWGIGAWRCSVCGCKNDNLSGCAENPYAFAGSKYCPNCGRKMRKKNGKNCK